MVTVTFSTNISKKCCVAEARQDHFYPSGYALVTTSNFAHKSDGDPALPLYFSTDMVSTNSKSASSNQIQVNWTPKGHVFPTGAWPSWAVENMWAPEIHFVNGTFVVYFTGWYNHRPDKLLCVITGGSVLLWTVHRVHVGVAVSTSGSPWGPYTDPRGTIVLSFE